ncbi:MAG: cytochrome c [Acidobacteria bacterium]|nr:cytochrome c [Acidobacteriota bacterium]
MRRILIVILLLVVIPSIVFVVAAAQRTTVWSGVYTDAQAINGENIYRSQCVRCHGASLEGASAYPLVGDRFMDSWREDNLESLFSFVKGSMPPRAGDPLSDNETLALVSYILWFNYFPAGDRDLTMDALRGIQVEYQDGPRPLPNNSVIQTVGCLTKGDGDTWLLTSASAPGRTRRSERPTPEEVKTNEFRQLGNLSFRLQNFAMLGGFKPEAHAGHKMLTRGVLMRQPTGDLRISLTALAPISDSCR